MPGSVNAIERGEERQQQMIVAVSSAAFSAVFSNKLVDVSPNKRARMHIKGALCAYNHESFTNVVLVRLGSIYKRSLDPWSTSRNTAYLSHLVLSVIKDD